MMTMKSGKVIGALLMTALLSVLGGCAEKEVQPIEQEEQQLSAVDEDAVVRIEGTTFTRADMAFYTLMQRVKNELNRSADAEILQGEALGDNEAYWDGQNDMYDNVNVQLHNLIEIHAMALLAEEKNYFVPDDKLDQEVLDFTKGIEHHSAIQDMIQQYGEEDYHLDLRGYMRERMLRDRIAADIEKTVLEELPDAEEQELRYEVNTRYDELAMEQISSLDREIYLR